MSPTLVLLQIGRPCIEFWESFAQPYVHYVPVAADLSNLTYAIEWASQPQQVDVVKQIIRSANSLMQDIWSTSGLYYYSRSLMRSLAAAVDEASATNDDLKVMRLKGSRMYVCNGNGTICKFGVGELSSGTFDPDVLKQ